jgi:hypothetical protein
VGAAPETMDPLEPFRAELYAHCYRMLGSAHDAEDVLLDDLDRTMDELTSRGVRFERYDQPGIRTDERGVFDAGDFRAAWVRDPDGNTIAIAQPSS